MTDLPPLPLPIKDWLAGCEAFSEDQMRDYGALCTRLAVEAEREACARLCHDLAREQAQEAETEAGCGDDYRLSAACAHTADLLSKAIRARPKL